VASPAVGVGVLVTDGTKVLLGRRRGAHGAGTWAAPGGHLEFGETVEACARREVAEETGLEIGEVRRGPFTSDVFPDDGKHYVTLFVTTVRPAGEPQTLEPDKCDGWAWFEWSALPTPLFPPLASLVRQGFTITGVTQP